ncbi:SEL1-like repeat protein [Ramlibacter sp. AN1133]|uniref:SEL1-like repeat protein n=1 Tax=Ramlibacter sp. AN1133 TaxID=3133429 RepID=UPI0030C6589E
MFKRGAAALFAAAAALVPALSHADAFDTGMNTLWEVLWHQSGIPTRLVRWEQPELKVSIKGTNLAAHKEHTLQALRDVAAEARMQVTDVSDRPDAAQVADVRIQITPDNTLSDNEPCVTQLHFKTETKLDWVDMQMRDGDARRCAYHESMHVMGVRGHPEGPTVLSYFTSQTEGLQPLDKAMLHAWYSPRTSGGMTPFEFLPILSDALVAILPDRQQAAQSRDRYLARTVEEMQAFADGRGDVPMIVKRSGKCTEQGVRFGRMEMSYFLGVAYQKGATVPQDPAQATRWLERAVNLGSRTAQTRLSAGAG